MPGATRRIDPDTLLAMSDENGRPLWNMPAPISYAQHKGTRTTEPVFVPVYRGTSASYARWVKAQLRRKKRKEAEAEAAKENESLLKKAGDAIKDLVLNPGGHNAEF